MIWLGLFGFLLFLVFVWLTYRLFFWALSPLWEVEKRRSNEKGLSEEGKEEMQEVDEENENADVVERGLRWWRFRRWFPKDE